MMSCVGRPEWIDGRRAGSAAPAGSRSVIGPWDEAGPERNALEMMFLQVGINLFADQQRPKSFQNFKDGETS